MPGGRSPKRKGDKAENEVIKLFGGERTYWQPEGGQVKGDVIIPKLGRGEVKRRKRFDTLYNWLGDNNFIALRADRKEWLIVMRASDIKQLLEGD